MLKTRVPVLARLGEKKQMEVKLALGALWLVAYYEGKVEPKEKGEET